MLHKYLKLERDFGSVPFNAVPCMDDEGGGAAAECKHDDTDKRLVVPTNNLADQIMEVFRYDTMPIEASIFRSTALQSLGFVFTDTHRSNFSERERRQKRKDEKLIRGRYKHRAATSSSSFSHHSRPDDLYSLIEEMNPSSVF